MTDSAVTDGHPVGVPEVLPELVEAWRLAGIAACEYLPAGLMNRNWKVRTDAGVFALKEFHDTSAGETHRTLEVLAELSSTGLPVPVPFRARSGELIVEAGGRKYCLLPWIVGAHRPGTDLELSEARHLGTTIGRLHLALNDAAGLPVADPPLTKVTNPEAAVGEAARFADLIAAKREADRFDVSAAARLQERIALIEASAGLGPRTAVAEGPYGWTHGDLQYRNLLWSDGQVTGILDWDRVRVRPFAEEVARTATVLFGGEDGYLDLDRIRAFIGGYRSVVEISSYALADGVHRLWWKRATDYWPLVFHYDRDDRSCDHFFFSGERLLSWWTDRLDEVEAAFTGRG